MSLSSKNLSSIQKAGQAVHGAYEAITETVHNYAEDMVSKVKLQPFGADAEQAISIFKSISHLCQGLAEVEAKMQELYAMANDLANPKYDVIAIPVASKSKISNASVVDVVAKPAKAIKQTRKLGRKPAEFTANDTKLLSFIQHALSATEWTYLPGSAMSAGAGIPVGSVGAPLMKFMKSGIVLMGSRAMYKLGAKAPTAPAPQSEPATAPAKKSKKAKAVEVVAPATKAVKAVKTAAKAKPTKIVKKAKAALSQEVKPAAQAENETAPV